MKKKLMVCAAFWLPTLALTGCGSQFGDKMVRAGMNTLMGMGCSDIHCISHIKI